jgi:hypothetical protein
MRSINKDMTTMFMTSVKAEKCENKIVFKS